ncbi:uncharacterized protein (DUF1684 family) [Actinoplanes octamycinicus]|uniref:Uncharacterized protein (DUF1684 family) n=1 Tax=Actinoplanes octamycinicus TaxID=135948 RepID=A0A7W7MAP6_9ACTN|nr:DUF1684 domain-containing protein [Actinoplanes octamycinicus]MBB4743040.1 uncharacterized protein (DUF1684 family) [Actinoplanes octamycinicus]GIE58105.1 hypothetical protein Aoc01nite_35070 [Actinoplanes octamycinicus]
MSAEQWSTWHAEHERRLADPHGFLAITSLNYLTGQPQRFPDAPGAWHTGPSGVVVELAGDESLTLDGVKLTGRHEFGVLAERSSVFPAFGEAVVEVAKRGGFDIVRPRHPSHPLLVQFHGVPAYGYTDRWRLTGRYLPLDEPRDVTVGAAVEGLEHVYESPGRVEFTVDGAELSLTVFNGRAPGSLFALFTDLTSGVTTYPANRSLAIDPPAADGTVILDFNRATNLVCAYTDFATCPLPPAENRLAVAVEAGERIPYERLAPVG